MYYIKKWNKNSLIFFLKEVLLWIGNYWLKNMLIDFKIYFIFIILFEVNFIIILIVKKWNFFFCIFGDIVYVICIFLKDLDIMVINMFSNIIIVVML